MEGGLSIGSWVELFSLTYSVTMSGVMRMGWPDGGTTLGQPALAIAMFGLVGSQLAEVMKDNGVQ